MMFRTIRRAAVRFLPQSMRERLRTASNALRSIPYRGDARWCPVCGKSAGKFRKAGLVPRHDAECPHCGAGERHRFVWLYLTTMTDLFDGQAKRVLHVAPERCFEKLLSDALGPGYLTADLESPRAMVRMDITSIQYADNWFDVIYCSHVLEHVPEDRRAIREFYRVLRPDGWAILLVPVTVEQTFEDPTIVEPQERLRAFGRPDHVRRYGPDFEDRLREAGFQVHCTRVSDLYNAAEATRMGLTPVAGEIYHCFKGNELATEPSPTLFAQE